MAIIDYSALNRRSYYRLPVDNSTNIRVFLSNEETEPTTAIPVNLSAGGMLCQLSQEHSKSIFSRNGETKVRIAFSNKGYVDLNGKIRRIESYGRSSTYDCAIQFTRVRGNSYYQSGKRLLNPRLAIESDEDLQPNKNNALECLNQTHNYMKLPDSDERRQVQSRVYTFFDIAVDGLAPNEQWWFYEVLDTLKSQSPNYAPALVKEYEMLFLRGLIATEYKKYHEVSRNSRRRIGIRSEDIGKGSLKNC